MTQLLWDQTGERRFETGVDHGVLYLATGNVFDKGYAWNGLTGVTETPSGAEATPIYADNIKYLNITSAEDFGATLTAYTYPDEFGQCNGEAAPVVGVAIGQQNRRSFGLSYRTNVGNDTNQNAGYKLHLIYGATAAPSERAYTTVNDSPSALEFSWTLSTSPAPVTGLKPTAILTVDTTKVNSTLLTALTDALYGTAGTDPRLPFPDEVVSILTSAQTSVSPVFPAYNSTTHVIGPVPTTTGVTYRRTDTNAVLAANSNITLTPGQRVLVQATANSGSVFPAGTDTTQGYTY